MRRTSFLTVWKNKFSKHSASHGGSPHRVAAFRVFCFGDLHAYLCRMIKIQNFRAMMLSCHIGTISILTDKEYIDVDISTTEKDYLLSERYYATDGKVLLYDLRSLVEQAMRPSGLAVMQLYFEAYVDIPDDHSDDYDRSGFMVIYCDRDIDIYDFEPLLKSHFLTAAASRRVAPESFVFLPFFAYNGELVNYEIFVDYVLKGTSGHCWFAGPYQQMTASSDGVWTHTIFCKEIQRQAENMVGAEIELTAFTVRVGDRAASFFIDKSLSGTRPFYFRNCFNVPDNLFVPAVTTAKTKVDRSLAVLGTVSQFYDATCEQTYEVQSAGLTADECSLAEQMFCSDDVRTPYESAPDDGDFDALRPVLITDSTSEIADDPEKPNTVKFAWRYAENRIAQRNPLGVGIFTEPYDYTFR